MKKNERIYYSLDVCTGRFLRKMQTSRLLITKIHIVPSHFKGKKGMGVDPIHAPK